MGVNHILQPSTMSLFDYYLATIIIVFLYSQIFKAIDSVIVRDGLHKPYYGVHVIHNLLIVITTVPDLWNSFFHFNTLYRYEPNYMAANICFALHLYHVMYYWRVFRYDDWLHHGLMVGIALPLSLSLRTGPLLGANLFFTTGLPGAISYGLLFANRNGWIDTLLAKRWNAATNLWIRAPGCVAHATLSLLALSVVPRVTNDQTIATLLIAVLTAWNGLYFMEQSIRANVVAQAALHPQDE
jgi:hypothetical protein